MMIKEIHDQPTSLSNVLSGRISADGLRAELSGFELNPEEIKHLDRINFVACGTAYYASEIISSYIRKYTNVRSEAFIASEFPAKSVCSENTLTIGISQSGETADTFAALDLCKKENLKTCSVVNVVESSIARQSDCVLPIHAGPEIGVASTKAFLGQMLVLYLFSLKIGEVRGDLDNKKYKKLISNLKNLPQLIKETLKEEQKIQLIAKDIYNSKGSMFLGRGSSYPIAMEGALKLKELSYLHAEGYPAGEMKHGPLALIEEGMPVVVLAPRDNYYKKTISNMQEVIARGAKVLLITNKSKDEVVSENIWETIEVENTNDDLLPFLLTIPLQKLAYYSALKKGYDIDKPRNLAKSVTVE